jgi:hypothetical protein
MMDYFLVEKEVEAFAAQTHAHLPKLHFVGGLGMVNDDEGKQQNIKAMELDKVCL